MGRPKKRRLNSSDAELALPEGLGIADNELEIDFITNGMLDGDREGPGFGRPLMPDLDNHEWPAHHVWDGQQQDLDLPLPAGAALPGLTDGYEYSDLRSSVLTDLCRSSDSTLSNVQSGSPTNVATPTGANASLPEVKCACLSTMYLSLSTLQSMPDSRYPTSLHTLRDAISTAWDVLHCVECPRRFLTGMHNVHLLGVFLFSIAERYAKVLDGIDDEEARASAKNEMKTFRLDDLTSASSHLHSTESTVSMRSFTMDLAPAEWRSLAKKVVKAEVLGTSDGCCPCLVQVIDQLEARQHRWHENPPAEDLRASMQIQQIMDANKRNDGDPVCMKLAVEARHLVQRMTFE